MQGNGKKSFYLLQSYIQRYSLHIFSL